MTRRVLSIAASVVGLACAAALVIAAFTIGGTFADARSEGHAGSGLEIFVRTPFVRPADDLVFDVVVRGADRVGIKSVTVINGNQQLAYVEGTAAAAGAATSAHAETARMTVSVPATLRADAVLYLLVSVDYVVSSGAGAGAVEARSDFAGLDVTIYDDAGLWLARVERLGLALLALAVWSWLVHAIAVVYRGVGDRHPGTRATRIEQAALAVAYLASAVVGYWLFAWRIATVLGLDALPWLVALVGVWLAAPIAWLWHRHRARQTATLTPRT